VSKSLGGLLVFGDIDLFIRLVYLLSNIYLFSLFYNDIYRWTFNVSDSLDYI